MQRVILGLTLIGLAIAAGAAQELPLPPALQAARTAIVVNAGVNQDVYERLILELNAWKRFQVVTDPSLADLTITIAGENVVTANGVTGAPMRGIVYRLTFTHDNVVLYSDTLRGCCTLKAMTRKTLERLDQRLTKR